ncbi:c-type cytochrome [Sedimentitalea nanhaiensis]|uniref:Cytochrome c n=1 Tax=Sedimentitalea nanhaiensis TaxID=999627 RepID=A0A1I7ASP1_9RHOB|nr:cytochrome c [Sedimentitalea nanhaiensis]SFT77927.1 Cytochrome c [Sedimentitalea nanhaiensis]
MRALIICLTLVSNASPAAAQDALGLAAPEAVADTGLLKHILPRFSLKTGIRVAPDADGPMQLANTAPGVPVFEAGGTTYFLRIQNDPRQQRFLDWLNSEIGKTTVDSFAPDGVQLFSARFDEVQTLSAPTFSGNAARGARLSLTHCGRCHVIGPQNRMKGLGSTPSFPVLRSLSDWDLRFQEFFVRKPHAAFTQIKDVTPPFDPERPSPIVPMRITLQDLDAILAFVAQTEAADLGAPLQSQ